MDIIRTVVPLVTIILIVIPSLLIKSLNSKKNARCKQFRFPVIALLFSVVCTALVALIGRGLDFIINLSFVQKVLNWISPNGKFDYVVLVYTAIIANALILFAFFIIKSVAKIRVNKKKIPKDEEELRGLNKIYWRIVSVFHNIEAGASHPQRNWVKIEATLKYSSWIISALYLLLLVFLQFPVFMSYSWIPYDFMRSCIKAMYMWPVISLILINEFRWFLQGKEEFAKPSKMVFDHSEFRTVSDYGELAEQYKLQFPERFGAYIVGRAKGTNSNFYNDVNVDTKLESSISDQLRERGYTINANFLSCVKHLSNGENALIDASIFSDFGEYLFVYLNTLLSRGDNVLFLCADDESAENFSNFISDKFKAVNNYHKVWIVKDSESIHKSSDADVLVLTPQLVLDDNAFIGQDRFFRRLSTVIMINAAEIIAKDGAILALLAHKLSNTLESKYSIKKLQYVCLSESVPPETSNALKQILNLHNDLYICDGYQSFDNTHLILWNYEAGKHPNGDDPTIVESDKDTMAQDNLFGDNSSQTYWGVSLPIACVGMKYMVSKISVISHTGTPYVQIVDSMKNQVNRLTTYFNSEIGFSDFDKTLILNRVDSDDSHTAFIIIEDDLCNLPLAIYNYCRFGGTDTTMIHIVSKPYMLRDYFTANAEKYISNESKINMIMPALSDTKQIIMTKLLCEALEKGVKQTELLSKISSIEPTVTNFEQALEYFRDMLFPERKNAPLEYYFSFGTTPEFNTENVEYDYETVVRLKIDAPMAKLLDDSRLAKLELRGKRHNMGVFKDRLYQNFVPSQNFIYKGVMYRITDIDSQNGIVHVTESSDRLNSPVDFVQVRRYQLQDALAITDLYPVPYEQGGERITRGYEAALYSHAHISVDTIGYYALSPINPSLDFVKGPSYKPLSEADQKAAYREYIDANVVSLKIKGVGSEKSDCTAFLLSVMMNEMMKTIFPYSHNCIAVCPIFSNSDSIYDNTMGSKISTAYPQIVTGDYYEHNADDVEVLIIEDSASDVGMVKTLLQNEHYPFGMFFETILSYLNWFNTYENKGNISNQYLFFGAKSALECFDFDTLTRICDEFDTVSRKAPIKVDRITSKGQCSYCHRDLFNVQYTEVKDHAGRHNRKLCAKCAKLIVSDENELKKLYRKVRKYLCDSFGIELSEDINVRFATAEKIRKKLKTGDQRVVVGFADPKSRELWVEADAPAANVLDVLAHELTHFWQFDNIDMSDLMYVEGHASYVEVQYMKHENRTAFAEWQEASLNKRQDEYGEGFRALSAGLDERGDYNSFTYMLELFGDGGSGRPPHGGGTPTGGDSSDDESDVGDDIPGIDNNDGQGEINRTPDSCPRYAFNLLDDSSKKLYSIIKDGIVSFESEVTLEETELDSDGIFKIIDYIKRDYPEVFWLGANTTVMSNPTTGKATSVKLDYCMTKATAISRQKKIDESLRPFFESVNSSMSDYAVVEKIYENIIGLVDYDSLGLDESKKAPKGNKPDNLQSIYGVFVKKKAVCAGYAVATQYLLNRVGIECTYIRGDTTQGYHAWNLLKLEGDYYYMDTTWGDSSNTDKTKSSDRMDYDYFCITTEELLKDHTPDADFPVPECTATKCNYHHRNNLFYEKYSFSDIQSAVCKIVSKGKRYVSCRFATNRVYGDAQKKLIEKGDFRKMIRFAKNKTGKKIGPDFRYSAVESKL